MNFVTDCIRTPLPNRTSSEPVWQRSCHQYVMSTFRNRVLGCAAATTLLLVTLAFIAILRDPQRTPDVPQMLSVLAGIAIIVLLLSGLGRRTPAGSSATGTLEGRLTEIHDWGGDRVEIVVERYRNRGWIGRVRFAHKHLVWEERGATAQEAYRKALEFFRQACPDHKCGAGCGRVTTGKPATS